MEYKLTFKQYNESLKQDKLLGLKCKACSAITVPPKMVCRQCTGSDMEVIQLAGKGEIVTFTTVNVAAEGRENELPYTIVMVKLEEAEKRAADNYDKYVRTVAELDNYRKRAVREKADAIKYGNENLLRDILPLVDNVDRALEHAGVDA